MLNETARKAGVPIHQSSLLDYVNGGGNENENTLLGALSNKNSKSSASSKLFQNDTYDKMEKSADELNDVAEALLAEGEDSIFAKAKKSGDNSEVVQNIEKLVNKFNTVAKNLKSASGSMNDYYYQMLLEAAKDGEGLSNIGVSLTKDGTLSLDKEKLKASSVEDLEKALTSDSFAAKVGYLSGRVADHAKTNAQSIFNQYNSKGSIAALAGNRYDFWG